MKPELTPNERLVRAMRVAMASWAAKWRVIRREHEVGTRGRQFIAEAVRCRDKAARWQSSDRD